MTFTVGVEQRRFDNPPIFTTENTRGHSVQIIFINLCQLTYFKRKKLCVTLYYSVVKKIQNSTIN